MPVITYIAIATWVIWLSLGMGGVLPSSYLDIDAGGWPLWSLQFAVAVFVIGTHSINSSMFIKLMYSACPCGLALAAPTACFVGGGLCAKYGILANGGGEAFQEAAGISCVVFDKTGTLTKGGEPIITDMKLLIKERDSIVWTVASELEKNSSHPLASAITAASKHHQIVSAVGSEIEEIAGRGLRGFVKVESTGVKYQVIIGNERWMEDNQAVSSAFIDLSLEEWKRQGNSIILLGVMLESGVDEFISGDRFTIAAVFAAADPIRADAAPVVADLQSQGIAVWMISGDNSTTAKAVAKMVGIREECVIAGVLPQEKVFFPTCKFWVHIYRPRRSHGFRKHPTQAIRPSVCPLSIGERNVVREMLLQWWEMALTMLQHYLLVCNFQVCFLCSRVDQPMWELLWVVEATLQSRTRNLSLYRRV